MCRKKRTYRDKCILLSILHFCSFSALFFYFSLLNFFLFSRVSYPGQITFQMLQMIVCQHPDVHWMAMNLSTTFNIINSFIDQRRSERQRFNIKKIKTHKSVTIILFLSCNVLRLGRKTAHVNQMEWIALAKFKGLSCSMLEHNHNHLLASLSLHIIFLSVCIFRYGAIKIKTAQHYA